LAKARHAAASEENAGPRATSASAQRAASSRLGIMLAMHSDRKKVRNASSSARVPWRIFSMYASGWDIMASQSVPNRPHGRFWPL